MSGYFLDAFPGDPYRSGAFAHGMGHLLSQNPFPEGTEDNAQWQEGWWMDREAETINEIYMAEHGDIDPYDNRRRF